MRIVVFGATGDQGSAQVRALARSGHSPVAVSRNPKPWTIAGRRIETVAADYGDLVGVAKAVAGSDAVFLNLPSTSFQAAEPLIAAANVIAREAAASPTTKMLVFNTSLPVPGARLGFAAQDARHEMRRLVFAAGIPAVSIQPVVFLENLLNDWAWPSIKQNNRIVYAHKETLDVSWICHDDLAELMLAALERPELAGRSFAVGGPEAVRLPVLTQKLSRALNRPLSFESQSITDFCQEMRHVFKGKSSLAEDTMVSELHRLYTWYNNASERPFCVDMGPILKELPVRLTPIEEWAARLVLPVNC
ncbi:MAG: NmrA family NAD(P)-binding protein [Gallionella sp.]|nr:NmrA family NAD(P)-binding protein [Gallionella sp.]